MKFILTLLLSFVFTGYSQNKVTDDIDQYVRGIESNSELIMNEYDWNKITGGQVDHGATLTIWKLKNQILKIQEEFGASYGRYTRLIYLKNGKPIKGVEIEENFEFINNEIDYSHLNKVFEMQVYITGFNDLVDEYESEIIETGKRKLTDPYCDVGSFFHIIDQIKDL